ncbi:paraquat-inducible protein A [Microbulbifer thermotolerans]|uniref:Paraquat-inducible protein A n=1 Tax=Microbulbifer thermotolerans TaxID=252514 RepID=A0A143HP76_MICTH|nr:paraquat-inducible protein A [Microbulbifer thermotolerans]AMX03519.1 paraquat-inducible protein A [Microbulbifer thermotolerans]MCX2778141.1 paraquat-inducible protein A [Microbulbifer thermotolerans]MCX2782225.1 paraquat-inducible protein A [Microbulbifer thermotolerans]MCX2795317.1 paraquat-inducible protein A [Microbulbifer thermotolerans]MCX2801121.1 paraquat-inducible protein A [Microbulbifer thermotolerans]
MQRGADVMQRRWQRACHECDLLITDALAPPGQKLVCPRCNAVLHRNPKNSIRYTAALSLTGLLLFIPAATLPLMHFSIFAFSGESTLLNGVAALFNAGYVWLSALVLFCSVLAPLVKFLLLAFICWGSAWAFLDGPVAVAVRWYRHLKEWGMLDVYMLGVLVALIKMRDLGKMEVDVGLYCFVAMMLVANLTTLSFDPHVVWARMERRRRRARAAVAGGTQ